MKELALLLLLVLLLVVVLAVIVLVRARLRVRVVIGCSRPARDGDLACDLANREAILVARTLWDVGCGRSHFKKVCSRLR